MRALSHRRSRARIWARSGPRVLADFRDVEGLCESALHGRLLGFTGKWGIHPDQGAMCNDVSSPSAEEVARARCLLAVLAEAEARGDGGAPFAGAMIDQASRKAAEALLARSGR